MYRRLVIAPLAIVILASFATAQMRGPMGATGQPSISPASSVSFSFGRPPQARPAGPRNIFLAAPYFYPEYVSEPAVGQAPPQVVVVSAPPGAAEVAEPSKPAESLLIEWSGDRYLRVGGEDVAAPRSRHTQPDYSEEVVATTPKNPAARQPQNLSPVVILFHDGRRREVNSYAIVSGVMYTNGDYWSTGSWTEKIRLADLDVPATLRLNQERGVKFLLPSGPNEVVTRP